MTDQVAAAPATRREQQVDVDPAVDNIGRGPAWLLLLRTWLLLDFFGESRRTGEPGSTLTTSITGHGILTLVLGALLYPDVPRVPFVAAMLSVVVLSTALSALAEPPAADRRRADEVLLATAPVRGLQVTLARGLHGLLYVAVGALGAGLPPAILFGFLQEHHAPGTGVLGACGFAVAAVALAALARGALSLLLLPIQRWRGPGAAALAAGTLRALVLGAGLAGAIAGMRRLDGTVGGLPWPEWLTAGWPPYHAAKVLVDPLGQGASWVALGIAFGGLGAIALLLGPLRSAGSDAGRSLTPGVLQRLLERTAGPGPVGAIASFTGAMLHRSAAFRSNALPLIGVPAALVVLAITEGETDNRVLLLGITLQFPALCLPIAIGFLPPTEQRGSGAVFHTAPALHPRQIHAGVRLALFTHLLLPIHGAALVALLAMGLDPLRALALSTWALGLAGVTANLAVRHLTEPPFSADDRTPELPGGAVMTAAVPLALLGGAQAQMPIALGLALGLLGLLGGVLILKPTKDLQEVHV